MLSALLAMIDHNKGTKMSHQKSIAAWWAAFVAASVIGLAGCESQGPFEEAGEEADQAVDEVEDQL